MSAAELKLYHGNCHCGAFKFTLALPELTSATACDCSICFKKGYLWAQATADHLRIVKGESELGEYTFGPKSRVHKFCAICGTGVLAKKQGSPPITMINVRPSTPNKTEQGIYTHRMPARFSGDDIRPAYDPPRFKGKLPDFEGNGLKVYTGSCHCGAVTVALMTKPLPECEVKQDNCSICIRNAYISIYPSRAQVAIDGNENTTAYTFGNKFNAHRFCKTCGVPIYMDILGPPQELVDTWPEARKAMVARKRDICPINLNILNDVEWDALKVIQDNEGTTGYSVD